MDFLDAAFVVAVIVMSAVIHEVMHGVAAEQLGDPTARLQGRITLNPISHLDPFGSVLLPIILVLTNAPIFFAWAKPVPYNPYNLRPGRFSEAVVAGAGPASNLAIALIGGLFIRLGILGAMSDIVFTVVLINVMLFLLFLQEVCSPDSFGVWHARLLGCEYCITPSYIVDCACAQCAHFN